jgi:hypothetical protein
MRLFIPLIVFVCLAFASVAHAEPPPGNIYATAPFANSSLFSSAPCSKPFECDSSMRDEDYLKLANACAAKRFGFPTGILTLFQTEGVYENCALPETYAPKGGRLGGTAQWPICCVEEKENGLCNFNCYYYLGGGVR